MSFTQVVLLNAVSLVSSLRTVTEFPIGTRFAILDAKDKRLKAYDKPADACFYARHEGHVMGPMELFNEETHFWITERSRYSFTLAKPEWCAAVKAMIKKTKRDLQLSVAILVVHGYTSTRTKPFVFDQCYFQSMTRLLEKPDGPKYMVEVTLADDSGKVQCFTVQSPVLFLSPEELHGPLDLS